MADKFLLEDGSGFYLLEDGTSYYLNEQTAVDVSFGVTGVTSASALGDEVVSAGASASPSGVVSASALGSESVTGDANISPTGVSSVAALGDETVDVGSPDVSVSATGVFSASALGNESVTADAAYNATGTASASALGDESVSGASNYTATGVTSAVTLGNETISVAVSISATGATSATALGNESVTVTANPSVAVVGVESASVLGDETVGITNPVNVNAVVAGVSSLGLVDDVGFRFNAGPISWPEHASFMEAVSYAPELFASLVVLSSVSVTTEAAALPTPAWSGGGGFYGRVTEKKVKEWQNEAVVVEGVEAVARVGFAGAAGYRNPSVAVSGVRSRPALSIVKVRTTSEQFEREAEEALSALLAA